jgi:hypothetical protein
MLYYIDYIFPVHHGTITSVTTSKRLFDWVKDRDPSLFISSTQPPFVSQDLELPFGNWVIPHRSVHSYWWLEQYLAVTNNILTHLTWSNEYHRLSVFETKVHFPGGIPRSNDREKQVIRNSHCHLRHRVGR